MKTSPRPLPSLLLGGLLLALPVASAHAADYPGNGNNGFGGAVGGGTLSVNNNGSGGFLLLFALAGGATSFNGANNDLVIYLNNGGGGGIGNSTAGLNDAGDSSRTAVSQFGSMGRSTLGFSNLISPQIGIDLSPGRVNIFALSNNSGNFGLGFLGGSDLGSTTNGVTYSQSGSTFSLDLPASVLNLTPFSGATLSFLAINVSNTGFSSNEATVGLTGSQGFNNTQTITSVNAFTAAVPEPTTWAMLAAGAVGILAVAHRRRATTLG